MIPSTGYRPLAALASLILALPVGLAGPLNPPAGPIASTHKTLTEVEPRTAINATNTPGDANSVFKITQPGSYYLAGNVAGVSGKHGIEIEAGNVSIDLNGFSLVGGSGSFSGVVTNSGGTNVTVRNGELSEWGISGVELSNTFGTLVEGVLARNNGQYGIRTGTASVVRFCSATFNTSTGIIVYNGGVIESCYVHSNGSNGMSLGFATTVLSCVARENTGNGINATGQATITNCSAYNNTSAGINGATGSVVESCAVFENDIDGILASGGCIIRGNVAGANGTGAGVRVTGSDNRVEGNNSWGNTRGVQVTAAGNFIVRNICSGNGTNWDIAVGNAVAPIVNATTNGAAILGNTYAGSLGNTDPNANFTY